jgi:hypothetical protein
MTSVRAPTSATSSRSSFVAPCAQWKMSTSAARGATTSHAIQSNDGDTAARIASSSPCAGPRLLGAAGDAASVLMRIGSSLLAGLSRQSGGDPSTWLALCTDRQYMHTRDGDVDIGRVAHPAIRAQDLDVAGNHRTDDVPGGQLAGSAKGMLVHADKPQRAIVDVTERNLCQASLLAGHGGRQGDRDTGTAQFL